MPTPAFPAALKSSKVDPVLDAVEKASPKPPASVDALRKALRLCAQYGEKVDTDTANDISGATEKVLKQKADALKKFARDPLEKLKKAADQAEAAALALRADVLKADPKKNERSTLDAVKFVTTVVTETTKYVATLETLVGMGEESLKERTQKIGDEDRADDKDAKEGDERNLEQVKARLANTVRLVRQLEGAPKPMQFMIGVIGSKQLFVYIARTVSGGIKSKIKEWMNAGSQSVTFYEGTCIYEANAYTFVGAKVPTGGFATRIQRALNDLIGKKLKIRVRRDSGERDEAAGDDDDDEAVLKAAQKRGGADAEMARRLTARRKALVPALAKAVERDDEVADDVKASLRAYDKLVAEDRLADAGRLLGDIERDLLDAEADSKRERDRTVKDFDGRVRALKSALAPMQEAFEDAKKQFELAKRDAGDDQSKLNSDALKARETELKALGGRAKAFAAGYAELQKLGANARQDRSMAGYEAAIGKLEPLEQLLKEFEDAEDERVAAVVKTVKLKSEAESRSSGDVKADAAAQRKRLGTLEPRASKLIDAGGKSADALRKAREEARRFVAAAEAGSADAAAAEAAIAAVDKLEETLDEAEGGAQKSAEAKKRANDELAPLVKKSGEAAIKAKAGKRGPAIDKLVYLLEQARKANETATRSGAAGDLTKAKKAWQDVDRQTAEVLKVKATA